MYDLIGDIHGYSEHLKALLAKLGYRRSLGVWSHPERKVIFLGDFVDRGKGQIETVQIARSMVESGHALAGMGNHEFNAVAYATPHPDKPGEFLRPHNSKNRKQHQAFLDAVGEGSNIHKDIISWFSTLPIYLDLPELRVVHACWHAESLKIMRGYLDDKNRLLPDAWIASNTKDHEAYDAVEILLKGLEIPLPEGIHFFDKDKNRREHIRSRWWSKGEVNYRAVAIMPPEYLHTLPEEAVSPDLLPGYDGRKPLFLGHYWLQSEKPEPLTEHIACLDYSVASEHTESTGAKGKLVAYRWQGESVLTPDHFVWVSE